MEADRLTEKGQKRRGVALGIGLAAIAITFSLFLTDAMQRDFYAMLLVGITTIYLGFALADGRPREVAIEVGVIVVFSLLALGGLWLNPVLLVVGYFAHGIWDVVHHPHGIQTQTTSWYPPFCLVVDWLIGAYLVIWLVAS